MANVKTNEPYKTQLYLVVKYVILGNDFSEGTYYDLLFRLLWYIIPSLTQISQASSHMVCQRKRTIDNNVNVVNVFIKRLTSDCSPGREFLKNHTEP